MTKCDNHEANIVWQISDALQDLPALALCRAERKDSQSCSPRKNVL